MPILLELVVLLLFAYALGLAAGWLLWGRNPAAPSEPLPELSSEGDATP